METYDLMNQTIYYHFVNDSSLFCFDNLYTKSSPTKLLIVQYVIEIKENLEMYYKHVKA